jgi:hypothetical protein
MLQPEFCITVVRSSSRKTPLIGMFVLMRASDLPDTMRHRTWVEPPLVIRTRDGRIHPE